MTRQTGMSGVGMICTLLVLIAVVSVGLKVGPAYIDYRTIQSVVNALPADRVHRMPRAAVYEELEKRFPLNNLSAYKAREVVQFERRRDVTLVTIAYEKRESLFRNLDVVIKFEKQYQYQ
jgi:hypothetical protein